MKDFFVRLLSSIIYAVVISLGIMSKFLFYILFSVITFFCLREFYGLISLKLRTRISFFYCLGGVLLFTSFYLFVSGQSSVRVFCLYLIYIVYIFILELYQNRKDSISYIGYVLFGQCYIALPISLLNIIAFNHKVYSSMILLSLFIFIWTNDSMSFIFGRKFGKHLLLQRISPKKTWEGCLSGLIFTFILSFIFAYFFTFFSLYHWIGLSIIISLFGTLGDLVESLIKRTLNIKDSGSVMPGHGGFLDRLDSLLLVNYVVCFYLEWFIR